MFTRIFAATLAATTFLSAPVHALAEDDSTYVSTFNTLTDGMASVSLVWTLHTGSYAENIALQAILSAKVNSPTDEISTRQSIDFRTINNVDYAIGASPTQFIFTVQAPQENFAAVVDHVAAVFAHPTVDPNWLKRQNHAFRPISATRLRTPEILEAELVRYANFPDDTPALSGAALQNEILRSPNRIIMNGKDYDFGDTADILMNSFESYDAKLNDSPPMQPRPLPTGTIYLADPDSTETLVFMGQTREFGSLNQQAQTDTLFKYMGYGPGSEMFRIVRQEKRASYDPRSHFTQIGEQRAFTGLSATVPSEKWPEIHDVIVQIYTDARAGKNNIQGLENSRNAMLNSLIGDLRREPNWLVHRYLELYPSKPPEGRIMLDLLDASFDMDINQINTQADNILPSSDNLLTVIIGGAITPSADMQKNGFCALPVGEPLAYCLDKLSER